LRRPRLATTQYTDCMSNPRMADQQPNTPTERAVAELFWEISGIDQISRFDNFYTVGGGSLNLLEVLNELSWKFGVDLNLAGLLEYPTIVGLAQHVDRQLHTRREAGFPASPAQYPKHAPVPLSIAQERVWRLVEAGAVVARTVMTMVIRFGGPLDAASLIRSLEAVVRRHEILRTRVNRDHGVPNQCVSEYPFEVELIDGPPLDSDGGSWLDGVIEKLVGAITLESGPLARMALVRTSGSDHMLVVAAHSIICDSWSLIRVLPRETSLLYHAFTTQRPARLREMRCQYAEYSSWQRDWLKTATAQRDVAHLLKQLGSRRVCLPAGPLARTGGSATGTNRHVVKWPKRMVGQVARMAEEARVDRTVVFIAAFEIALADFTAKERFTLGSTWSQRNPGEVDSLFGNFVTSTSFEADLSGAPTFNEVLSRVRSACQDTFVQQFVPVEALAAQVKADLLQDSYTISFQARRPPAFDLPGISAICIRPPRALVPRGISVQIYENEDEFECECTCTSSRYAALHPGQLASKIESVLEEAIATNGDQRIAVANLSVIRSESVA
jgi:hypothetical protein